MAASPNMQAGIGPREAHRTLAHHVRGFARSCNARNQPMTGVAPWVPVEPTTNPAAILGPLPFDLGSVSMPIPTSVVPAGATGILVFACAVLSGVTSAPPYCHFASRLS